jgi:hypothetical protein
MPEKESQTPEPHLPSGFTPKTSGLASEYARELGWGIKEEERTQTPQQKQNYDGGKDYDYGPRDFGDEAVDTSSAKAPARRIKPRPARQKKSAA